PTAERPVVHAFVLALRPVPNVPEMNRYQSTLNRQLENALRQVALEDLREQGQDVEPHRHARRLSPQDTPSRTPRQNGSIGGSHLKSSLGVSPLTFVGQGVSCEDALRNYAFAGVSAGAAACCSNLAMYFLSRTATFSDGWAPTLIQYLIRSGFSFTRSSV